MKTTLADVITAALLGKEIRVGNDRKYREVASVEPKRTRWCITYTDGETRYITSWAKVEFKERKVF